MDAFSCLRSHGALLGASLTLVSALACGETPSPAPNPNATSSAAAPTNSASVARPSDAAGAAAVTPARGGSGGSAATMAGRNAPAAPSGVAGANPPAPAGAGASPASGGTDAAAGASGQPSAAGSAAGASGASGSSGDAGGASPAMDLGMGDGSDVIEIGDSWMAGIAPALNMVSGQPYRNYSRGGTPLLQSTAGNGGRQTIPQQYEMAKMVKPDIKTVVLTAGGIDLSEGAARDGNEPIEMGLTELMTQFGKDGVRDVVYFSYSRGSSEMVQETFIAMQTKVCAAASPVRCHFIDSDTVINRMLADGIHPTQQGSMDLAKKAYMMMTDQGMRR